MFIIPAFTPASVGYPVARSLRFNSADSAYLSRTFTTPTNNKIFTFSTWLKRGAIGSRQGIFVAVNGGASAYFGLEFSSGDAINVFDSNVAGNALVTSQLFRDPAAWYHIVLAVDTTQATNTNRLKLYVNGSQVTAFSSTSYPSQNSSPYMNTAVAHAVGSWQPATTLYFDGYMAEVYFVDGTALTPSTFGETSATTGQWVPKQVTGVTYGTNGFYLPFSDNSGTTSTTLGKDSAGSNNWTPNNFSVTAGVGNDSLTDAPTNNFCVFNKLTPTTTATLTNGNLDASASAIAIGSFGLSSGLHYWEVTSTGGTTTCGMHNGSATSTTTVTTGNTKGFRFDANSGTFDWTSDGSSWTSIATGLTSGPYFPYVSTAAATTASLNAGQRTLAYTVPSGYSTLCTSNLATPSIQKPSNYFDVDTYTGTGATRSKTGVGFQPDLVWFKGRSGATDHALYDAVRGAQKQWESNTSTDETTETTGLTAFNADGYTIGALAQINTNTATYAAWMWREGATPGLDVVTYTGAGAGTVAHSLGVVPTFIIVKARTTASTDQTAKVYHASLANTEALDLGATSGKATGSSLWNSTTPTSSVFSVGSTNGTSGDTYVAYIFSEVAGFSRFGSYTGNANADGPFVHCGFRPRFVLIKCSSTTGSWWLFDTSRDTYNVAAARLVGEATTTEASSATLDILSNGFKLRTVTTDPNASQTYVFAAFAEAPFKSANAR